MSELTTDFEVHTCFHKNETGKQFISEVKWVMTGSPI